jgi:hypothetical protein
MRPLTSTVLGAEMTEELDESGTTAEEQAVAEAPRAGEHIGHADHAAAAIQRKSVRFRAAAYGRILGRRVDSERLADPCGHPSRRTLSEPLSWRSNTNLDLVSNTSTHTARSTLVPYHGGGMLWDKPRVEGQIE